MILLIGFAGALLLSAISMPLIIKVAQKRELYDAVDERKIHTGNIPRLGGLGIFISFLIVLLAYGILSQTGFETGGHFWALALCMFLVYAVGFIDDLVDLRARYKFIVELSGAVFLVALGFRFYSIALPFQLGSIAIPSYISYPLTVIWILGVTNALNLIDGMDGLAGGVSAFTAAVFGVFFLLGGDFGAAFICFTIMGSIFGFLIVNLPPAKIFMGDSGALFLGFSLSILPLIGPGAGHSEIGFVPAVTVLLIPIYDTFSAIIRRTRAGLSVFSPDKLHLHHKLLDLGLSVRGALGVIYSAQVFLCLIALSGLVLPAGISFFLNIAVWLIYAALFYALGLVAAGRRQSGSGDSASGSASETEPESGDSLRAALKTSLVGAAFSVKRTILK